MYHQKGIKALLSSFFNPPVTIDTLLREAAAMLVQCTNDQDPYVTAFDALAHLLHERAIECLSGGELELRRDQYPDWLYDEVCGPPFARRQVEVDSCGLYLKLSDLPEYLRAEFLEGRAPMSDLNGEPIVFAADYLPFINEHCRDPLRSLHLFADHPVIEDIKDGLVRSVIRYGRPYITWNDQINYSHPGSDPSDWWLEDESKRLGVPKHML